MQDEAGKQLPSLTLSARSAADAASICALLHALRGALLAHCAQLVHSYALLRAELLKLRAEVLSMPWLGLGLGLG